MFFFRALQFADTQAAAGLTAFTEMPSNAVQFLVGIVVGVPLASRLARLVTRPTG